MKNYLIIFGSLSLIVFAIFLFSGCTGTTNENNLVYKACKGFLDYARKKRKIKAFQGKFVFTIEKNIPISAGMGGGSSDCATALKLMNKAYGNILKESELLEIGASIGADVAFCLIGGTCECRGVGDKIKSLRPFKDVFVVCAIDSSSVSTKEAYKMLDERYGEKSSATRIFEVMVGAVNKDDTKRICDLLFNKFEQVIIQRNQGVAEIKSILLENSALGALMSGSGPSVFGIFKNENDQIKAYNALKDKNISAFLCKTL